MAPQSKTSRVPQPTKGDYVHTLAKAGISAIPVIGGPGVELFSWLMQPPLERRKAAWMEAVGEKLAELEANGVDLKLLQENDQFVSAVMHATTLALRAHETEKLEALRNALVNIAMGQEPNEARRHFFLECVGSLSELHLRILRLFQKPPGLRNATMGGLSHVLEQEIPNLRGFRYLYDQFWNDLFARGLVGTSSLHTTMSANGLKDKRTTDLGDMFLGFISEYPRPAA